MKHITKALIILLLTPATLYAQQRISDGITPATINGGAILELQSSNRGLLLSHVNLTSTTTWGLSGIPVAGMLVYNTNTAITSSNAGYPVITGGTGTYYWNSTGWVAMKIAGGRSWQTTGNTGTVPPATVGSATGSANFWDTRDAQNLAVGTNDTTSAVFKKNSIWNNVKTSDVLHNHPYILHSIQQSQHSIYLITEIRKERSAL